MVDRHGNVLDGDTYGSVIAKHLNKNGKLNHNTIVVSEYSNSALELDMANHGIKVQRVGTGDRAISPALIDNDYSLGWENSGHFLDQRGTADAVLTAVRLLSIIKQEGKSLEDLITFNKYPAVQVSVDVSEKREIESMPSVVKAISDAEAAIAGNGRVFVRYSGTEPKIRILVEGPKEKLVKQYAADISEAVAQTIGK